MHGKLWWAALGLGLILSGCGGKKAFDGAAALEQDGDRFAALEAYREVAETYGGGTWEERSDAAIERLVGEIVEDQRDRGAPGFELPEECTITAARGELAEAGVTVTLDLTCEGRAASTSGRVLEPDKVWDTTPIEGVLAREGECVFRSVANPFGDWAIPLPEEECHFEQQRRKAALDRIKRPGGTADFLCDCRVGEATFEIPRGEPMWKTGPPQPRMTPEALEQLEQQGMPVVP